MEFNNIRYKLFVITMSAFGHCLKTTADSQTKYSNQCFVSVNINEEDLVYDIFDDGYTIIDSSNDSDNCDIENELQNIAIY